MKSILSKDNVSLTIAYELFGKPKIKIKKSPCTGEGSKEPVQGLSRHVLIANTYPLCEKLLF